jgi:hypothetical protein
VVGHGFLSEGRAAYHGHSGATGQQIFTHYVLSCIRAANPAREFY